MCMHEQFSNFFSFNKIKENIRIIFFFKSGQIYMKDAELAESKENEISNFSCFYLSSYGHFFSKNCQFSMNFFTITREKKIGKIRKLSFYSFQHVAHL